MNHLLEYERLENPDEKSTPCPGRAVGMAGTDTCSAETAQLLGGLWAWRQTAAFSDFSPAALYPGGKRGKGRRCSGEGDVNQEVQPGDPSPVGTDAASVRAPAAGSTGDRHCQGSPGKAPEDVTKGTEGESHAHGDPGGAVQPRWAPRVLGGRAPGPVELGICLTPGAHSVSPGSPAPVHVQLPTYLTRVSPTPLPSILRSLCPLFVFF